MRPKLNYYKLSDVAPPAMTTTTTTPAPQPGRHFKREKIQF